MSNRRKSETKKDESKGLLFWLIISPIIFAFLLFVNWFKPNSFPIGIWDFWKVDSTAIESSLKASIPIFIWGASVTFIACCFQKFEKSVIEKAHEILQKGFVISLIAGVFEEMIFRWLVFYFMMISNQIFNFFFFGFISESAGIPRLVYWYIIAPIVNFFMFFKLDWLLYEKGWIIGSAAISANSKFRDEHAYLGFIGYLNSWVLGFFFFWIMFSYGIPAAILVHFLYDFVIFGIIYLHVKTRKILI